MATSETLTLVPKNAPAKLLDAARTVLQTELLPLYIDQSPILGIFCALNSKGVVLPSFAEREEERLLKKAGLNVCHISEKFTPGNTIVTTDKAALVHPRMEKVDMKKIADALGVEVFNQQVTSMPTVGSVNVATARGVLAYNEVTEEELKQIEGLFGVRGGIGTVNLGSPFVRLGIVANSKGALVGDRSSGFETQRIYEALFA